MVGNLCPSQGGPSFIPRRSGDTINIHQQYHCFLSVNNTACNPSTSTIPIITYSWLWRFWFFSGFCSLFFRGMTWTGSMNVSWPVTGWPMSTTFLILDRDGDFYGDPNGSWVYKWRIHYIWLVVDLPIWKIWKPVGSIIPNIWKKKIHVPNHQPDIH